MGFFSSESGGVEEYPQRKWQKEGISYLQKLLRKTVDIPTQQVAGMTDTEKAAQSQLASFVSGDSFEDPATSKYWQGMRDQMTREEQSGVAELRRRSQLGGMFNSGPSFRAEGDYRANMANQRNTLLGSLYNQERQRDNPFTRAQAGMAFGGLPRQFEQMGFDASQQSALANIMFPYQTQANIANTLMAHQPNTYMSAPQQSGFSQMMGIVSPLVQMAGGIGMGGAAGGGTPANFGAANTPGVGAAGQTYGIPNSMFMGL